MTAAPDKSDELVPDPKVCAELNIVPMTLYRWDHDPELGFPPKIQIRKRNYRSRRALEAWKAKMMRRAVKERQIRSCIKGVRPRPAATGTLRPS